MNDADTRTKTIISVVGFKSSEMIADLVASSHEWTHGNHEWHICENGGVESFSQLVAAIGGIPGISDPQRQEGSELAPERLRFVLPGERPLVLYRAKGNLGYSGGINVVLQSTLSDTSWSTFWVLNPDTAPEKAALSEAILHLSKGYGIVGMRLINSKTGKIQQYGGRWRKFFGRGYNVGRSADVDARPDIHAVEAQLDYASGASMLLSRAFVEQAGLMDERYFLYSEEVDWCMRRGSEKIGYAHDAIIHHDHGATIGSSESMESRSPFSIYLQERSGILLTRKFFPALLPIVAVTSFLFVLRYWKAGGRPAFSAAFGGWLAGVRGETGFPARFLPK